MPGKTTVYDGLKFLMLAFNLSLSEYLGCIPDTFMNFPALLFKTKKNLGKEKLYRIRLLARPVRIQK